MSYLPPGIPWNLATYNPGDAIGHSRVVDALMGWRCPPPVMLGDAPLIRFDPSAGTRFRVTLGGNRTLANPNGAVVDGEMIMLEVTQDGTGSRTLSYGSDFVFSSGLPQPTLSTTAGFTDLLGFYYCQPAGTWRYIAQVLGFGAGS